MNAKNGLYAETKTAYNRYNLYLQITASSSACAPVASTAFSDLPISPSVVVLSREVVRTDRIVAGVSQRAAFVSYAWPTSWIPVCARS